MKEEINILFCCDTNYVMPLAVCLTSIFENNKAYKVQIFILHSKITKNQEGILLQLAKQYDKKINLTEVDSNYFKTAPTLRWSKEAYYRLLITELLPRSLSRVLYLDCDTIVNQPLQELYFQDLGEFFITALKTEVPHSEFGPRLGLKEFGNYYQSGVILFDLDKTREILNYEKALEVIDGLGNKITTVDQDVINFIFYKKIKDLDIKFNNDEITNYNRSNFNRLFNKIDNGVFKNTVIFHYATGKPWNNIFSGSCENIWYTYLKLSPYRHLYSTKYSSLKYKIFRTNLFKIIFYEYVHLTPIINGLAKALFTQRIYVKLKKYYRKNIK